MIYINTECRDTSDDRGRKKEGGSEGDRDESV